MIIDWFTVMKQGFISLVLTMPFLSVNAQTDISWTDIDSFVSPDEKHMVGGDFKSAHSLVLAYEIDPENIGHLVLNIPEKQFTEKPRTLAGTLDWITGEYEFGDESALMITDYSTPSRESGVHTAYFDQDSKETLINSFFLSESGFSHRPNFKFEYDRQVFGMTHGPDESFCVLAGKCLTTETCTAESMEIVSLKRNPEQPHTLMELSSVTLENAKVDEMSGFLEYLDYDPVQKIYWVGKLSETTMMNESFRGYDAESGEHLYTLDTSSEVFNNSAGRLLHYQDNQFVLLDGSRFVWLIEIEFPAMVDPERDQQS